MNAHLADYPFFAALNTDSVVLTPNRRLSATLHKQYQQYQLASQLLAWQTPSILPVTSWAQTIWNEYTYQEPSPYLLLNTVQEQYLWETILLKIPENEHLLQISETADLAKSAWGLLRQWQVDINHPSFSSSLDYTALQHWIKEFQSICKNNHWIDIASLPDFLIRHIEAGDIIAPKHIILFGFTEYSPQLKNLLHICELGGSQITYANLSEEHAIGKRISLTDQECEIQTMARWAKLKLKNNHTATIACVIPSLDKIRDRVVQVFSEVFAEDGTYTINPQHAPFNISAGKSLTQYPLINTAFHLLSLYKKNISSEAFSYILATPFIGEAEVERIKRAHYDRLLRKHNKTNIQLNHITNEGDVLALTKFCPQLANRINAFVTLLHDAQQTLTYSEWAQYFTELLTALGWPGERSLDSEEYQLAEAWINLLREYMTLDHVAKPISLNKALHMLQKMAKNSIFQPKSPEAAIQVLGVLEAAALPFNHLWVTGMDDVAWPPQPKPHPFIPKVLQRELQMPHATAERELMFCEILINQFKQSTNDLIISHAEQNQSLELQPSPLIRDIPTLHIENLQLEDYTSPSEKIFQTRKIESISDEIAPRVTDLETIRGGVSVIKQQALCPFKSFSEWRLHAHDFETPLPGLRAKDRGNIIHKTLEIIWNELKDHATLISKNENELNDLLSKSIDTALITTPHSHSEFTQYLALEKQRLHKLLNEWLQIEKAREPFVILKNEKAVSFTLGELPLTIKIDRIDELADGRKFIIDYKTGKNNEINTWFTDRPEEPQLPLYALLDPDQTFGISFAQVHTGEAMFKGVSETAMGMSGIKLIPEIKKSTALSWAEQLTQWSAVLTQLSQDFYCGDAKVDPKDPPKTCDWCSLKPLCRIHEV